MHRKHRASASLNSTVNHSLGPPALVFLATFFADVRRLWKNL